MQKKRKKNKATYPIRRPLPPNVHLLTMERLGKRSVLLRLEHFYEKGTV
jgi:hypothetical protein